MTSSWTSAQACSSSSAENSRSTSTVGRSSVLGHRAPAPVGERRAQSLAAAQHELLEGGGQLGVVGADVGGVAAAIAQVLPQLVGDGAGQLDG